MNPLLRTVIVLSCLGAAPAALAGAVLHCTGPDGAALSLSNATDDEVAATTAILQTAQSKTDLSGKLDSITHGFATTVQKYSLTDAAGTAYELNVSYQMSVGRGGCGRAGCPGPGTGSTVVSASLESAGRIQNFGCEAL